MSTALSDITGYFGELTSMLNKGQQTASGSTDDKDPGGSSQVSGLAALTTDARSVANRIFTSGLAKLPAELLAMGDTYDTTQACSRIAKVYSAGRDSFYEAAKGNTDIMKSRLEYKQSLATTMARASQAPKEAQEYDNA